MKTASKITLSQNNFNILKPKVTKNIMNSLKKFCESPPSLTSRHGESVERKKMFVIHCQRIEKGIRKNLRKKFLSIIVTNCPSCSQFHQHFFLSISFCNEHTNLIKEYRKAVKKISFLFLPHCVINVDKASYTYSQC